MPDQCVLLVEGRDDQFVLKHLLEWHNTGVKFISDGKHQKTKIQGKQIVIRDKDGIDHILDTDSISTELDASGLERLGIIIDADSNVEDHWKSIRDILTKLGYSNIPKLPETNGTIIQDTAKQVIVGIWIMPNNQLPGSIEDFAGFLIPAGKGQRLWRRAKKAVEQIPAKDREFPAERQSKAYIHTWLAWQDEPGKPMGQAITARYLDAEAAHAKVLMAWINRLFELRP